VRVRDARHAIGVIAGASWLVATMALALLWCGHAFAAQPKVVLLRGWFGVFSTGMDSLADELKAKGIHAQVAGHMSWKTAVSDILRERAAGKTGPLVLMGHSQGANNVIDMARALAVHNVRVDLLVTLVPLMQNPVPANVVRAINYYQSPGIWGSPLVADPGFHGKLTNIDVADDPTILHISIDKSARIHSDISREILALSQTKTTAENETSSRNPPAVGEESRSAERKLPERAAQAGKRATQ
jgi:thioesterase domain-containing protein